MDPLDDDALYQRPPSCRRWRGSIVENELFDLGPRNSQWSPARAHAGSVVARLLQHRLLAFSIERHNVSPSSQRRVLSPLSYITAWATPWRMPRSCGVSLGCDWSMCVRRMCAYIANAAVCGTWQVCFGTLIDRVTLSTAPDDSVCGAHTVRPLAPTPNGSLARNRTTAWAVPNAIRSEMGRTKPFDCPRNAPPTP